MITLVGNREIGRKPEYVFSFLCMIFGVIQLAPPSLAKYIKPVEWKLDIPSDLNKADFERFYVGGMLDPRNEKKLEYFKRSRHHLPPRGLGAETGLAAKLTDDDVFHVLYRQSDKDKYHEIKVKDADSLAKVPFEKSKETLIIVHGWMNNGNSWFPNLMKNTLLNDRDMNVIVVDWSSVSYGFVYPWTAGYVPEVGAIVGNVISQLISSGHIDVAKIHFIGHSLGAHVSGFAGKTIHQKTNETVPWITGLDPARPCFNGKPAAERLDATDADFVEIIHTCGDYLGLLQDIGHIDYYPNGGAPVQPGCSYYDMGTCSHARSFQYYAEAMVTKNGFIGYPCANAIMYMANQCNDANSTKKMGKMYSTDWYGKHFLTTRDAYPFHAEEDEHNDE